MTAPFLWILLLGFFAGQLVGKLKVPPLVGMILCGIALGSQGFNVLPEEFLAIADELRTLAVMVILVKAGLGLDRQKLIQQSSVALRLGFLPATCEMIVVAIAATIFFPFDFPTGLLLGCVLAAESPAVIVPGMIYLKTKGWGVKKGIPDAILTGSALSDVLVLLVFNLLVNFLSQSGTAGLILGPLELSPLQLLPLQVLIQILGGIGIGYITAKGLNQILRGKTWAKTMTQSTLITACIALLVIVVSSQLPFYSGYLAVMTLGFILVSHNPPLARTLRQGFDSLWAIAQIILFVLLGASIQLDVLQESWGTGLLMILIGTVIGRGIGWYLSTLKSNWNKNERLYLLAGNSAKATVQAAIGAIPLSLGLPGGEMILALSALSILVTAPIGAWAIPFFAKRLLSKDPVDPTQINVAHNTHSLVAISTSTHAITVLKKAAEQARQTNGTLTVLHVDSPSTDTAIPQLKSWMAEHLKDIDYHWLRKSGDPASVIVQTAQSLKVSQVIIGQSQGKNHIDSFSQRFIHENTNPTLVIARAL